MKQNESELSKYYSVQFTLYCYFSGIIGPNLTKYSANMRLICLYRKTRLSLFRLNLLYWITFMSDVILREKSTDFIPPSILKVQSYHSHHLKIENTKTSQVKGWLSECSQTSVWSINLNDTSDIWGSIYVFVQQWQKGV